MLWLLAFLWPLAVHHPVMLPVNPLSVACHALCVPCHALCCALLLAAFLRNEVSWFDSAANSSGAVAGRLASTATLVRAAVTDRISVAVQNLALVLLAFTLAFFLSWRMALASLATFPLLLIATIAEQASYQAGREGLACRRDRCRCPMFSC